MSRARRAAPAALLLLLIAACSAAPPPDPAATPIAPMATASPAVAAAASAVEAALAPTGRPVRPSPVEHRPGEPAALQATPRAVYRIGLTDPNEGWLLIYDLGSADAAQSAGSAFASYLGSGVGQTNYPRDAQFTLNRVGSTLVFGWWSRERSSDPEAAAAAYAAIATLGQAIEIRR